MRLNIREIKKITNTGVRVLVNIIEGNTINQVSKTSSECIKLIQESEHYECKRDAYGNLREGMKLYTQISEDIKIGKCELY